MAGAGSPTKMEDFRTKAPSAGFAIAESTLHDWRKNYLTDNNRFHAAVGHGASAGITEDQESLLAGFVLLRRSLLQKASLQHVCEWLAQELDVALDVPTRH